MFLDDKKALLLHKKEYYGHFYVERLPGDRHTLRSYIDYNSLQFVENSWKNNIV